MNESNREGYRVPRTAYQGGDDPDAREVPDAALGTRYAVLRETPIPGPIPRFEIPGWRDRYGVVAGITGRGQGEGRGFDLGLWTDAPVREIMGRWQALRQAEPGFPATILGTQVHQTTVALHETASGWTQVDGIDGHVTRTPGLLLTITVADCIPVYLLDPVHRVIGLLHAGWRGTAGAILERGIELMTRAAGTQPASVIMHCGVGICAECYEVGSEVMTGCGLPAGGAGPWHLDLRQVLAAQATRLGVREISTSQWCSSHDRTQFFSHRGSGGRDGRMVAYLGIPLGLPHNG